jgi:hypothetical protein
MDDDEGGILDSANGITRRKPSAIPVYSPENLHDLSRARNRSTTVANRRVTAGATALPRVTAYLIHCHLLLCASGVEMHLKTKRR